MHQKELLTNQKWRTHKRGRKGKVGNMEMILLSFRFFQHAPKHRIESSQKDVPSYRNAILCCITVSTP